MWEVLSTFSNNISIWKTGKEIERITNNEKLVSKYKIITFIKQIMTTLGKFYHLIILHG